ncbi:hypothetical protein NBT05_02580 [Aquimarina sp. ERC-38]|uniref:hypothetical protein n=1 Tax=Aquimarina sp. ERC-38 TaxID=2949996 RepID=UPI0022474A32|nr:hypothetical protein [Aquimarina sp. ERC-38]UZO81368.1 hypothetical protein NBT05_02580 [Aquimarina sp. ERC-38]
MKAQRKRHIASTKGFDHLIPQSIRKDTVIVGHGKARLEDTLQLMQVVIQQTKADTALLAKKLTDKNLYKTCKGIWHFVYQHIQYKMDKTGVEQVRRPSRTWADRFTGVDCDCYTVFIGSILTNLGIPFKMRITKYGGKHHFQHVYPIVTTRNGNIIMDCVTDQFNYEVPYTEKKDIEALGAFEINGLGILCGVDTVDISLDALEETPIPLREVVSPAVTKRNYPVRNRRAKLPMTAKPGRVLSPFRLDDGKQIKTLPVRKDFNLLNFLILSGISIAAGIGVLKLVGSHKKENKRTRRDKPNTKKGRRAPSK